MRVLPPSLGLICVLALSCGDDDLRVPDDPCFASNHRWCNVQDPACQQRIFDIVSCLREAPGGVPPTIQFMTPEQWADLTAEADPDVVRQRDNARRALTLLGLASEPAQPPEDPDYPLDYLYAFYSWVDATVTFVAYDDGLYYNRAMAVLAHEYVHAQQDREHDLAAFVAAQAGDALMARRAVIEGEATLYEVTLQSRLLQHNLTRAEWHELLDGAIARLDHGLVASAYPVEDAFQYFPYNHGTDLVLDAYEQGGPARVAALFADPPPSTQAILYRGEVDLPAPDTREVMEFRLALPQDLEPQWAWNGAWLLRVAFLVNGQLGLGDELAREWREDVLLAVYDGAHQEVALLWVLGLGSADAASRAANALESLARSEAYSVIVSGDRVFFVAADSFGLLRDVESVRDAIVEAFDAADDADRRAVIFLE